MPTIAPVALATCWSESVRTSSGTAVGQRGVVDALSRAGVTVDVRQTTSFGTSWSGLMLRWWRNQVAMGHLGSYRAVLGVDGEGWLWARRRRDTPYVAVCKGILADVVQFEPPGSARLLQVQAAWERSAARAADRVVVASRYAARQVSALYGVPQGRIEVVPEPFDFSVWRRDLPRLPREPMVLAVGHAYSRKNYPALLAAWTAVQAVKPEAQLVVVGAGPESDALRRLASGHRSVRLLGHVSFEDLRTLYARATVFCHPSLQENFGIAAVEALASDLAVVAHQQPAVMETLDGIEGTWCVDARQSTALSQAILTALDHPARWPESRLELLRERLAPERVGAQLARLLASLGVALPPSAALG